MSRDKPAFPIGVRVGDWTIERVLDGGPDQGRYRALPHRRRSPDEAAMIVSMASPQRTEFVDRIGANVSGIAPMLGVFRVVDPAEGTFDAMVEPEPPGSPLSASRPGRDDVLGLAIGLASLVARVHAGGHVLDSGVRPELVYSRGGDRIVALVPRAPAFFINAKLPSYGTMPCFDDLYAHPEASGRPADDVFALCATLVYLVTGRAPFAGERLEQLGAATLGVVPPGTPEVVAQGLARDPSQRPLAAALVESLARNGGS